MKGAILMEERYVEKFIVVQSSTIEGIAVQLNDFITLGYNVSVVKSLPMTGEMLIRISRFEKTK